MHIHDFANVPHPDIRKQGPMLGALLSHGYWWHAKAWQVIPDPLTGGQMYFAPDPTLEELEPFAEGLRSVPKSGLHNPLRDVERARMLGEVNLKAASALHDPEIFRFFARLIQTVMPKSLAECEKEVLVTRRFLENFAGDNIRFMLEGFMVAGDRFGQESFGYRWPYGPVAVIAPFNFPLEIPALQTLGALYGGNRPLIKVDSNVSVVMEQFVRLLIACGLPARDLDLLQCSRETIAAFMERHHRLPRLIQFTGSSGVADWLSMLTRGKVRVEDAGFDWKILGPDASFDSVEYVAWQCDQDAYAASGQKCSAQSMLFVHENWMACRVLGWMKHFAEKRSLSDLTIGPVMTWPTDRLLEHVGRLAEIPGARILFGGRPLEGHAIPSMYGAIEPTAVFVPLEKIGAHFHLVATEVFGPVQVVTSYDDRSLPDVLALTERMSHHLTAAIVSEDRAFIDRVLGATVNGVTYVGMKGRTTGAPQNHWFGPAGDPRAAGIGTVRAIRDTWTCHREIIRDNGPIPADWKPVSS